MNNNFLKVQYDNDSALGINNSGELTMTYGYEDTDYKTKGDSSTGYAFNAATSVFFCRIRDLFVDELQDLFVECESSGAWSASGLITQFENWQDQFPEELWRLDIERKYLRSYREGSPRFLTTMMQGRKKYQRRQFERDQEKYMATKFFGNVAVSDQIMFRCNTPTTYVVAPDYTLHLTPFMDMYISVMFGATYRTQIRAEAGQEYDIECPFSTMDDTAVLIYCGSQIQAIGDLSACYIHDNDFSNGTKLKKLVIGNATSGYSNSFLTTLNLGTNMPLIEYLDIQNTPNLVQALDLSGCPNLEELYAYGSGLTGIIFANGGMIRIAQLPGVTTMTMKNLLYLTELALETYENILTLIIEYCDTVDVLALLELATNVIRVRILGIDWTLEDTTLLTEIYNMYGIDANGYNITQSVLSGTVYVPTIRQQELANYNEAWSDLEITYSSLIEQYAVTFVNEDGTILDIQYVDKGGDAVDPLTRADNPIATPTKESTVSTDYSFAGWDLSFTSIFAERTITATYSESTRSYTIKYVSKGTTLQASEGLYGENVLYEGDIPTYTLEESAYIYYLFTGWDQSGIIDGEKTVNAVFDTCSYNAGYFDDKDISELRPVEIYAMMKLGLESTYVADKDSIKYSFGNDYTYDDVESVEIISEKTTFDGTNYIDSGLAILDEDRDFVVAIDYKMSSSTSTSGVLAQCFQSNGSNGFKLWYNSGVKLTWGTSSETIGVTDLRDIVVIRHVAGEQGIYVYYSNLNEMNAEPSYVEISRTKETVGTSNLVFGCSKADDGVYEDFAVGAIYWAKVWYGDLGDSACKELALWTHEEVTAEMSGFKNYYLSDNSGSRSSMTFLAAHLLDKDRALSSVYTNSGGWAETDLVTFMNERMYPALNVEWRQLTKQVRIPSSIGDKSTDISYSDCYLTIPALIEVYPSETSEPYINEGKGISYMTTTSSRIRAYDGGDNGTYWTRSPSVNSANYYCRIDAEGNVYRYAYPNYAYGILLEISI